MLSVVQRPLFALWDEPEKGLEELSEEELRQAIRVGLQAHLVAIGLGTGSVEGDSDESHKERIRRNHAAQREQVLTRERKFVEKYGRTLINKHFAEGREIGPESVDPILCPVRADTEEAAVFRLATLLWSVPVSYGYGRRMRYLVRDRSNGKLIGLFGLADPVYNLRARDAWIGWTVEDRRERLVNLMDAHVVGAVPPYNRLLGGKLVAALMTSQEVCSAFAERYTNSVGIISGQQKRAQLVMITVTSALGRSSLYNRLKLPGLVEFRRIGLTEGWGHFQVPDCLFIYMRRLLEMQGHRYASGHQYGMGPNWRLRVAREALNQVGLSEKILRHGIAREIYGVPLVKEWREFLRGQVSQVVVERPAAERIGQTAVARWVIPRGERDRSYLSWTREQAYELLG